MGIYLENDSYNTQIPSKRRARDREMESRDPMDTATEFSVDQQDSIFGDSTHVEIWDKISFRKG